MGLFDQLFGGGSSISAAEAKAEMDSGADITVLDVREANEFKQARIPGAKHLPLGSVAQKAASMLPNKDARILVYCLSGGRSSSAVSMLKQMGYTNVVNFGGIGSWPYEIER